ncbi:MAG: hypothetical protein WC313_09850, partial [Candidatus Kapaibacterium sp.]
MLNRSIADYNAIHTDNESHFYKSKIKSGHSQILIQLLFDVVAIFSAYLLIYFIRFESTLISVTVKPGIAELMLGAFVFESFWLVLFYFSGMYKNWYERSPFNEMWKLLKTVLIGCAIIIFLVKLDSDSSPRKLYLLNVVLISLTTLSGRTTARIIEKRLRRNRILAIPSIIVGTYKRASGFYAKCFKSPSWGYNPFGIVLINQSELAEITTDSSNNPPILGNLEELQELTDYYKPEEIIISSDNTDHKRIIDIVSFASDNHIKVKVDPDLYDIFTGQAKTQMLYGIPLIEIRTQLMKPWQEV